MCSWRGHVVPGALVLPLDERHEVLARETVDGRRLVQCLRCGSWIVAVAPAADAGIAVDDVEELPRPRRGPALREAIVVRLIAVDRAVHAVAFGAVAGAAVALRLKFSAFHGWATSTLDALESARRGQGGVSTHGFTAALLTRLGQVKPHSLVVLALFASVYALVSIFESVGLWRERRWAEYLTVLSTAGFLPFEIDELVKRVTFVRGGALGVNLAIFVYLVLSKHLFGVRGPSRSRIRTAAAPARAGARPSRAYEPRRRLSSVERC